MEFMKLPRGALVAVAALSLAGLAACDRHHEDGLPSSASPSAQLIGTTPADPTGDPAGTTPVAGNTTEVSKAVESKASPLPGQANDHSNSASSPSQKAGSESPKSEGAAKAANSGTPDGERK
jgi:hypothetical protein